MSVIACAIVGPIHINYYSRVVCRSIDDLISKEDMKHHVEILSTVDISNSTVVIGEEFNTVVSVKEEKKEDYNIKDIDLYVYKNNQTNDNFNANNNKLRADVKTKLVKDVDYTIVNDGIKATIKVKATSITGKLEMDVQFKDVSFNNIVKFENQTIPYDGNEHEFKISINEGKVLPEGTDVKYTYNGTTQTDPFKFINAGSYSVSVTLTKQDYKTYNKTSILTISKSEMPQEKKDKIKFTNLSCKEKSLSVPTIDNQSGISFKDTPVILYKVNDNWTETAPTTFGVYPIKATLNFDNYNTFDITADYTIIESGKIIMSFDVKTNGGKWGESSQTEDKVSSQIKVSIEQKTFKDFKDTVKDYVIPTKVGHSFKGWYTSASGGTQYTDSTQIPMSLDDDITVYAQFEAVEYTVTNVTTSTEQAKFKNLSIPSTATYNTEVSVTAESKDGHIPDYILINDFTNVPFTLDSGTTYKATFTMSYTSNITIAAYCKYINYRVTQGTHDIGVATGSVKFKIGSGAEASSLSEAHVGDTITVTASNDTGYSLKEIEVTHGSTTDKYPISSGTTSFTMPASNCEVKVTATINEYTLSFDANVTGGIAPDSIQVEYNSSIKTAIASKIATYSDGKFRGWGENSTDELIITDDSVKMPAGNKTVYAKWNKYNFEFKNPGHCSMSEQPTFSSYISLTSNDFSSLVITPDSGYSFANKFDIYYGDSKKIENFDFTSNNLAPGVHESLKDLDNGVTLIIKPVITADECSISFINNGGTIKQNGTVITSLNLKTDDKILSKFSENNITATHSYAHFNHWEIYTTSTPTGTTIDENTVMPYDGADIKPIWDTYNFKVSGVNCSINGSTSTTINNKIELHDQEEFTITPSENYMFDHYEYSFTEDGTYTSISMPLQPYALDQSIVADATVYVKAVCVKCNRICVYANGGTFEGSDFIYVNVKEGAKWKDIKDSITKPTKTGATITGWTDGEGAALTDDTLMSDGLVIQPTWSA